MSTRRSRFGAARLVLVGALVASTGLVADAQAQSGTIIATVTDRATSQPLEAVRLQVGTSTLGGASDGRGRIIVRNVPGGQQVLRFTRIGYRPENQTVNVGNDTTNVTIGLSASAVELEQVVVTGTGGAVEKRKVGASLASVDVQTLTETVPTVSFQSLLSSKVAGLRSVGVGGGVGSGQDLRIRGIASFNLSQRPAVYIDGIRVDTKGTEWAIGTIACCSFTGGNSTDRMSDLNPNDIERVEVLKGAAAATLYGSEATNGVIQIFTKKGRSSADSRAAWNVGLGTGFNRLRENLPTKEFPRFVGPDGTRAKDANGLIQNGAYNALDLSVQGGTARSTYFVSGLLSSEEGSIKPNDQTKGNLRLNLTFLPTDKITIETRSAYIRNKVDELQAGNNWTALLGNAINGNPRTASKTRPYGEAWVPVSDIETMTTLSDVDRWTGGITVQHQVLNNLSHRMIFGLDAVGDQKSRFFPFAGLFGPAGVTDGQRNIGERTYRTYTVDYLASAKFSLPFKIESDLSAGAQGFWENERLSMSIGNKFPGPGVSTVSSAALTNGAEQFNETINLGFLAQNRFAWNDRLFTTVGVRIDGNSAFGNDYGFQTYPKVDLSYDLTKDGFLPSVISAFRIRGAIGKAGKMPGAFDSFTSFGAAPVFDDLSGIVPLNPGNKNLRPEVSIEREGGFEIGLWNDRLGVEASLYHQSTKDAIFNLPNPPSAGFSQSRRVNIGQVDNHGWEASINYLVLSRRKFEWTAGVRMDGNDNKVTDLGGVNTGSNTIRLGYPVQAVWGRKATGYSVVAGKPVTTRSDTNVYFGPPLPTFNGSLQNQIRIGPLQVYGLVSMERGAWMSNGDRAYRIRQGGADEYLKLLKNDGTSTFAADSLFQYASILDFFDKRDNVRLKELSLTYDIPNWITSRMRVGRSTLTVSGQNVMWWDDCHCVDPNMNWAGAASFGVASGFLAQPSPRQYRLQFRTKF
jgi:TonB-dependent starch-binding outer membrane protein SusC